MVTTITAPTLPWYVAFAKVDNWSVKVGDLVEPGQELVTFTAGSHSILVRAQATGVIKKLLVKAGEPVLSGEDLIEVALHEEKQVSAAHQLLTTLNKVKQQKIVKQQGVMHLLRTLNSGVQEKPVQDEFFEVMILATMSSGKSTLLNAMLGTELMPASNEACTARVFQIDDMDGQQRFEVQVDGNWLEASQSVLTELNGQDTDITGQTIQLRGDVIGVDNHRCKLSVFDTPGPNNSRDDSHQALTTQLLEDGNFGAVVYVMNATQFGVNDDALLLEKLQQVEQNPDQSHKRVIFALNKVDQLDPEKGETIEKAVEDAKQYLKRKGFKAPIIVPTSALLALTARKALGKNALSRAEKRVLKFHIEALGSEESIQIVKHAQVPPSFTKHEECIEALTNLIAQPEEAFSGENSLADLSNGDSNAALNYLLMASGITTLEALIDDLVRTVDAVSPSIESTSSTPETDAVQDEESHSVDLSEREVTASDTEQTKNKKRKLKASRKVAMKIDLTHNPFLVQSNMSIDGTHLPADHELTEKLQNRLQYWVEGFFDDINETFQAKKIALHFKGVGTDYEDLEASAREAEKRLGIEVTLEHEAVESAAERLTKIKRIIEEIYDGPIEGLQDNDDFIAEYEQAIDPGFDINVIATMSSGKSTVINSMLGRELLPAKNEATTATIARVQDRDGMTSFRAQRYGHDGSMLNDWQEVAQDHLENWNLQETTAEIVIEGDILGVDEQDHASLVLVDTPGPNNSRNDAHEKTTIDMIQGRSMSLVLYVLNGTQLGVNDDKKLLNSVREQIEKNGKAARDRFIFLVNKIDHFDPEKGEDPGRAVTLVKKYLAENGIENPIVIPVSAFLTLLERKFNLGEKLSRKERADLTGLSDLFVEEEAMHLVQYMNVSPSVKQQARAMLEAAQAQENEKLVASIHAGMPVVELVIQEYLDKYAFPMKLTKVHDTVKRFVGSEIDKEKLTANLKGTEAELKKTKASVNGLSKRLKDSEEKDKFKAKLKADSKKVQQKFNTISRDSEKKFEREKRRWNSNFNDQTASPAQAEQVISSATKDVKYLRNSTISELEQAMSGLIEQEQKRLVEAYTKYIETIFDNSAEAVDMNSLPALRSLKVASMSVTKTASFVGKASYEKEEKVGTRSVSKSKWYNPFSWGKSDSYNVYETKKYVDLTKVWEEFEAQVSTDFADVLKAAKHELDQLIKDTLDKFLSMMDERLEGQVETLMRDLESHVGSQEALEKARKEAQHKLDWLNGIEQRFESILSV